MSLALPAAAVIDADAFAAPPTIVEMAVVWLEISRTVAAISCADPATVWIPPLTDSTASAAWRVWSAALPALVSRRLLVALRSREAPTRVVALDAIASTLRRRCTSIAWKALPITSS